jgi:WS/DGAT/MGAT family acyltransferase
MRHLSALDALFLQLETPETPMHVGSLMRLEKPPGKPGAYFAAYRRLIASRLHLAPLFSRKLVFMPLDIASPIWRDAGEIDLDYHINRVQLPAPGSDVQLERAVAQLHEGMLDRGRPLWRFTVIEGLRGGEIGVYAKIHHAALDGEGGIAVAQALLDTQRKPRRVPAAAARPARAPTSVMKMLGAALRNTVAQYGRMVKSAPEAVRATARAAAVTVTSGSLRKSGVALGPRTSINHAIGPKRLFVATRIPLAEAKAIARHFDAKLNDAVLAICAGALRRYFAKDRAALSKPMIGAVPVSLRAPGDTSRANDVSMMLIGLATHIADTRKRMAAIVAASTRAKRLTGSMKGAIPTDLPSLGIPWLMASLTPLYRKAVAAEKIPVIANVAISNVPGPQVPLYLAGAELKAYYPVSIVAHGLGLNVTIVSYQGSLDFGLVAAKDAMPDLRRFARHLQAAHAELMEITKGR